MSTYINKSCLVGVLVLICVATSGCTNWKKKYENLEVVHQNVRGALENCRSSLEATGAEKETLTRRLDEGQQTIADLQRQIKERNASAGDVSGFGDKYQVDLDSAAGTLTVTLPNEILFSSGKADLKASSKSDLNHIVSVLQERYANRPIDIVGHTDSDPIKKSKWADNWELSAQRALSVVRYLGKNGIHGERLRAVGCGDARPVVSNETSSGKARNRRVEFVVHMR
ncbi:MAG: OmpA family protein [Planctomycetota bacterium]